MLTRTFMTHEELQIPEKLRDALAQVLGMLERGELRHVPVDCPSMNRSTSLEHPVQFNMSCWQGKNYCGTVYCIGGAAEMISGIHISGLTGTSEALDELFMPSWGYDWNSITTEQAAQALRNYLILGHPRWSEILE